jgi:flagellar motor protein MotB
VADEHEKHGDSHGGGGGGGHGGGGHRGGSHGGGSHEEHEGAPEWLISFADNVALMMGFFVVLLAMNMKPASTGASTSGETADSSANAASPEMLDFAIGIREAFNNPVTSKNPNDAMLYRRILDKEAEASARKPGKKGREEDVESIRPNRYMGLGGTIYFARDSASIIDDENQAALERLLGQRRGSRNIVLIRGHASAAEAFGLPDRGMRLSQDRAYTIAQKLVASGIGWNQIQIVGCADNDRLTPRAFDETGQNTNQRVEIIESDKPLADYESEPITRPGESPAGSGAPQH